MTNQDNNLDKDFLLDLQKKCVLKPHKSHCDEKKKNRREIKSYNV